MRRLKCIFHKIEFELPENEDEFLSGTLHEDVIGCYSHLTENPSCILENKKDER